MESRGPSAKLEAAGTVDVTCEEVEMNAPTTAKTVTELLDEHEVPYELIPHRRTMSAAAEARAIHVDPEHVAKTLILTTSEGFVRAVLPASARIDLRKVRNLLERHEVDLASEEVTVGAYPEFELGAVPPLGGPSDPVLVDRHTADRESVIVEAGTHRESVLLKTADLLALTHAEVVDICER